MDSAKYQSDIIYDIGMTCECVVFLQKGYILCMISRHAITIKVLEIPRLQSNSRSGITREFAGHESHRKRLEDKQEREW